MEKELFVKRFEREGMCMIENVLSSDEIFKLKDELNRAILKEEKFHGPDHKDRGMVLMCAKYGGELLKIFENDKVFKPFEWILGEQCIAYSNTSTSMPPKYSNYSNRIHVDAPTDFPNDYMLRMLSLIVLDDFNEENGATWFLPGSQNEVNKPSEDAFYKNAKRLKAKAGSILYWNPRIWHAGGQNNTEEWRHAFTIVMTRHFMKQRLDIPKLMQSELGPIDLNIKAQRRLGYLNVPPASYNAYYKVNERNA